MMIASDKSLPPTEDQLTRFTVKKNDNFRLPKTELLYSLEKRISNFRLPKTELLNSLEKIYLSQR